ncbi:MAG: DUF58 domain-containing protein [Candidatus Dormibacteraeota bacterium]|nr:DUF58 domain-containing protein [Candidatus Dormibacteraeota bacterium]
MTWRGAVAAAVPLVLLAAAAAVPALAPVAAVLLAVVLVTIVADGRLAAAPPSLTARRSHDEILSVGVANRIDVSLRGPASRRARVRDEAPASARAEPGQWTTILPATLTYHVTPVVRGDIHLGRTVVRTEGPLRLGWRQSSLGAEEDLHVDADIAAVRVYEALARRGQLAELGVRTLRLRSEGSEFERIRDAVPDDSLRSINWKATARSGRLMATELMPERAQPVVVCIDHGRLMGVGAGELTKLDHAVNAALLLLHVALRSGDRAGFVLFADSLTQRLAPRAGSTQLRAFLDAVRPLRSVETEADYATAFADFDRWQRRRALVVIFTDVLDTDQGATLVRTCMRLARRHLPIVVTVRDPVIDEAAVRAPSSVRDVYSRAVAAGVLADRASTLRLLTASGVNVIDADAQSLSPRLVNRYLELKRQARL